MSTTVSSWFLAQAAQRRAEPRRHFTIAGQEHDGDVLRWPTLRYRAGSVELGTTTVLLSNAAGTFNGFVDSAELLTTSCGLSVGFVHPDSGEEQLALFMGTPSHVSFGRGGREVRLQLQGKTKRLTDTTLGSDVASGGLDFTGSAHYPADLAWVLVTSHGGLSALAAAANPDVDYAEWLAWRDADVVRDVRVQAYLTGERIYEVLATLAALDAREVSFRNARLRFADAVQPFGAEGLPFPAEAVLELSLAVDPARITNQVQVEAAYTPATGRFGAEFTRVHSASIQRFGRRAARVAPRGVWFADAADARYLAEARVRFGHRVQPRVRLGLPLGPGLGYGVGDVVALTDSFFGLAAAPHRIVEQALDLEQGRMALVLEAAQHRSWQFQATVASATLRVDTLVAVGSDSWLALAADAGTGRVMRADSGGAFQHTGLYATAVLPLSGDAVLLGGAVAPADPQAVLQRSADGGRTAVVVDSLYPGATGVHALFRTPGGACLAAADSGAIYRSTDAGSSWGLTQTLSGAYHVTRFFAPRSGTLWGGTGAEDFALAQGLHLWASSDDGGTWHPHHTLQTSGTLHVRGLHRLSDSAWLLAHYGTADADRAVWRAEAAAPGSETWSRVHCGASFSHVVTTGCGHLLFGFDEFATLAGGNIYRSTDSGATWADDSRIVKRGNVRLHDNGDGTVEAFVSRMTADERTDRYRGFEPDVTN